MSLRNNFIKNLHKILSFYYWLKVFKTVENVRKFFIIKAKKSFGLMNALGKNRETFELLNYE
jgi:hypothetical protein